MSKIKLMCNFRQP